MTDSNSVSEGGGPTAFLLIIWIGKEEWRKWGRPEANTVTGQVQERAPVYAAGEERLCLSPREPRKQKSG